MNNEQNLNNPKNQQLNIAGVSTSFDAMDYAYDNWGETLNYMTDDEIEQIFDYKNKEEVDDYLRCFYERT